LDQSIKPVKTAILEYIRESEDCTSTMGTGNMAAFSRKVSGYTYETIRKVMSGDRRLTQPFMEAIAAAMEVEPGTFLEYRLLMATRKLDPDAMSPEQAERVLGQLEEVLENTVGEH